MRKVTKTIYKYAELSADAQSKARDRFREVTAGDTFFAECETDTFTDLLAALGFEVDTARGTRSTPAIYWSGFSSQGDGASFAANWRAELCTPSAWLDDRPVTYQDERGQWQTCEANKRWHTAAAPIIELAKQYPTATARVDSGRGHHMALGDYQFQDRDAIPDEAQCDAEFWREYDAVNDAAGEKLIEAARDLANAFYRALESEYDYQNSDAQIAESLIANDYEFNSDGSIYR